MKGIRPLQGRQHMHENGGHTSRDNKGTVGSTHLLVLLHNWGELIRAHRHARATWPSLRRSRDVMKAPERRPYILSAKPQDLDFHCHRGGGGLLKISTKGSTRILS